MANTSYQKRDVYATVTDAIIAQLEEMEAADKWRKPWATTSAGGAGLPHSNAGRARWIALRHGQAGFM